MTFINKSTKNKQTNISINNLRKYISKPEIITSILFFLLTPIIIFVLWYLSVTIIGLIEILNYSELNDNYGLLDYLNKTKGIFI